jgi:hypothetical protein
MRAFLIVVVVSLSSMTNSHCSDLLSHQACAMPSSRRPDIRNFVSLDISGKVFK